jgi:FkbM family methyltransferase
MPRVHDGTATSTLVGLFEKGVRFSSVIDLGCADGHFFLHHYSLGVLPGAVPVNVDANPVYEESLKAIKETIGGHYMIAAVTDQRGEVAMTTSAHPYWGSLRPPGDLYWERMNQLHQDSIKVQTITLDALVRKFGVKPPFLLKLDIQGAELQALRSGSNMLQHTHAVICETDIEDFVAVDRLLVEAGFGLWDITQLNRLPDQSLAWFYPIYINRKLDHLRPRNFWDPAYNEKIIKMQEDRRKAILEHNARVLAQHRLMRQRG